MRTMRNIFPVALAATLVAAFATATVPANAQDRNFDRNFNRDQARFNQQARPAQNYGNFGGRDTVRPVGPTRGYGNDRGYNNDQRRDFDRDRNDYRAYPAPGYRTQVDVNYIPPCPGPNYVWVAGYWDNGYWVEGQWVYRAPVAYGPTIRLGFGHDRDWDRGRDRHEGFFRR